MKLKRFKERDYKRIGMIVFTIVCILLVSGAVLYRTFAIFEVRTNQNVIKGTVQDPGNLYFAFYQKNEENGEYIIQKDMPNLSDGYVLDEEKSYCGVTGEKDKDIKVYLTEDGYIKVKGMKTSRTKCNLYFTKGKLIQGKGIPVVTSGDGLYEVTHSVEETSDIDAGWQATEYRYAGNDPNNYVTFNGEMWRIIGLVNVMTSDSKVEQRLKIIKNEGIGLYRWDYKPANQGSSVDNHGSNDWTDSQLMEMLNGIYFNSSSGACEKYESGIVIQSCDFTNNGIKEITRKSGVIEDDIQWNLGGSGYYSNNNAGLVTHWYSYERGTATWENREKTWTKQNTKNSYGTNQSELFHSIGLMYPSDFGYATIGGDTYSRDACFKQYLNGWNQSPYKENCANHDWLFEPNYTQFTITPHAANSYNVMCVGYTGTIYTCYTSTAYTIRPVVYLESNVLISSNSGSSSDPFELTKKIE